MGQSYLYLLSLEFRHSYFKDGMFKKLHCSFDSETQHLIKNLGLIIKPYPGGVHFLTQDPELLFSSPESKSLRIFLECNDPLYINYSSLPEYSPTHTVLYFNNLNPVQNTDNSTFLLHAEKNVGKKNVFRISGGKIVFKTYKEGGRYHFEDSLGNDISNLLEIKQIGSDWHLLSGQYNGAIHIMANGEESERIYANPKPVWRKPLAIVELYLPTLYKNFKQEEKLEYLLNFHTVKTKWKYIIVSPLYKDLKSPTILNGKKTTVFESLPKKDNDEKGYHTFQSIDELPLLEYSEDYFSLVSVDHSGAIIKALPRASPEQLVYDDDKKTMYSHIFI
ncbi:hypothetical protein DZC72_11820 [Maribacter algicola]|uniref:Uncharacterized protein n=1 Tax=Maribacter algicola TaxID=2498892 RepID=A0A3R8RYR1_9FLAO|nr:hypothetical protein [Maribacter algicola]RRQ48390.1 hypothetical protein DZC72_11820 [Maribacter algicola]